MRVGVSGATINDGTIDQVIAEARRAEADGFHSYWVSQIFGLDALTTLAIVGREVPRIEFGTGVVPTYPRHPMMLAQQALTTNAAAGGRLCLGIGLSHKIVIENMMGMSYDKPVRHLRDYLSVLGALVHDGAVSYTGEAYTTHASLTNPGRSSFPIVVAALGEQMLRVTARLADGTITWCTGPSTLQSHIVPTIHAAAEEAGRPAPRVVAMLPICVTDDVSGAKARAAEVFAIYGQLPSYRAMLDREGAAGPADVAILGSATEVAERVSALADIGVTDFVAAEFAANADEAAATREALKSLL
jgi:F420-dependent oxidoreductase-like protein